MKKIIFSLIGVMTCLALVGCSPTSDAKALTALQNQLNRVDEIVSSTSTTEVNAVSPYISTSAQTTQLNFYKAQAYLNMASEEELRQDVLSLTGYLKSSKDKKYQLGKYKVQSIMDLSNSLSKYASYLNNTKSEVKTHVKQIISSSKAKTNSIDETMSSYIALSNDMNERSAYLTSIYNSLGQIANILDEAEVKDSAENLSNSTTKIENTDNSSNTNNSSNAILQTKQDASSNTGCSNCKDESCGDCNKEGSSLKKNIDTYNNTRNFDGDEDDNQNNSSNTSQGVATLNDENSENSNNANNANFGYGMNGYNGINGAGPYGGANGYNGIYGGGEYNYRFNRFNPSRNTDTFYPTARNIDSYRFNPATYGYGYNGGMIDNSTSPLSTTQSSTNVNNENSEKATPSKNIELNLNNQESTQKEQRETAIKTNDKSEEKKNIVIQREIKSEENKISNIEKTDENLQQKLTIDIFQTQEDNTAKNTSLSLSTTNENNKETERKVI